MHPLEQRLGYKFRNPLLLAEALTHPSLAYESQKHHFDYQRLEFLGDAVLQLAITERLFAMFPNMPEGKLTKLRTRLVSRDALARQSALLNLGEHLLMGKGEEMSGGRERASTLADAFEALMGAIYVDSSLDGIKTIITREFEAIFVQVEAQPIEVNPKGQLQEILQGISTQGPSYFILSEQGPEHDKVFISIVMWEGKELGRGEGRSKKASEILAAENALALQKWK
jgi:ribonuclease-3